MPSSLKVLLHLLLLISTVRKAQSVDFCVYEDVSDNVIIVDEASINCLKVPETSVVGSVTCAFRVRNAVDIRFYSTSTIEQYNRLELFTNADNSITVSLVQTASYTNVLDAANPPADSLLETKIMCYAGGSLYDYPDFTVDVREENTQKPNFTATSYVYYGVPEIWPHGIDFSIEEFGTPIIAEDKDNTFGNFESPASEIIFELQGFGSEDFEVITVKNFTKWPYTYRALLSSKKPFDYQVHPSHQLMLIARNADGMHESTVNVTVVLKDLDNLNPAFTSSYYSTLVDETMITTPGTYPLICTPEIKAYDQDTGINETLTYSINTDCGDTSYCSILKTHFEINSITGIISFISNGEWPYQTTAISLLLLASQVDRPNKEGYAEVIVTVQQPGTVAFGYAH